MLDPERILRLRQLDVVGRRVMLRVDLDGPRSPQGEVRDDAAPRMLLPTVRYLVGQRAKVIVATSLSTTGREASRMATQGLAERLSELLGAPVRPLGWDFERELKDLNEGQVAIAPDLSAIPEDAAHSTGWASMVAASVDVYVLDGLQAARDGGASVVELPRILPARGVGYEIDAALDIRHDAIAAPAPERYSFVLGGGLRKHALLARAVIGVCSDVLVGGAVANTFLVAQGWKPGGSPYEADSLELAKELLALARSRGVAVHVPVDAAVRTTRAAGGASLADLPLDRALQPHEAAVDIGPETCTFYRDVLAKSATVLWVGLMGECSAPETQRGSQRVALAAAEAARPMAAGRETVEAVRFFRLDTRFRVAVGGDAVISLLAGAPFPGLDAVMR